jgi:purine-nucleoside phosphorylase
LGIVLGSGFGGVLESVKVEQEASYADIPGLFPTNVEGHAGKLVQGHLGGRKVALLAGRIHYYEGHSLEEATFPIRMLGSIGVKRLLLTSAAGAVNSVFRPGHFMAVTDHLNLLWQSPLRGLAPQGENRFPDLTELYDSTLLTFLRSAAKKAGVPLHEGIYACVCGPTYETPAEVRALALLGADAVGMSLVPEAIVARQCGIKVCGLVCLTNMAAGVGRGPISHEAVLSTATEVKRAARQMIEEFARLCR